MKSEMKMMGSDRELLDMKVMRLVAWMVVVVSERRVRVGSNGVSDCREDRDERGREYGAAHDAASVLLPMLPVVSASSQEESLPKIFSCSNPYCKQLFRRLMADSGSWRCEYVDVEGAVVGGYPDTLITIQSHVEKDELCGERSRRSWSTFRFEHSEGTNLVNGMKYFGRVFVRKSRSHHKCITSRDRSSTYHPDECLVGIVV
ncbi:hypothetical protein LR48_Vigan10g281200 [Vigna angularis]|uniref:Uncharacterized protein n=1 Tax=Phaseolus angularis TaxID=3914 RepID=A0A0L9VPE8_PHAAN|nr:hypothetical protein LR48_Vigan10g281200 [Vigna angularis]